MKQIFIVNLAQLTKILDVSQFSLYASLKNLKHKNEKGNYKIDIDSFLIENKVNNFKFLYELDNSSFADRLKENLSTLNKNQFNLHAKQVRKILKINNYKLYLLRKSGKLEATQINPTRYKYSPKHLAKYMKTQNLDTETYIYKYSKQFYDPNEITKILRISRKTVYRYIYDYNKIPCIKISGSLKIPIIEFNKSVLEW